MLLLLHPLLTAALAQEPVTPTGRVDSVVVFPDRAQVTRLLEVKLVAGTNRVEFHDLPPTVDENTLAAEGSGVDGAQILGLDVIRRELAEDRRARVSALEEQILALGDAIRVDQDARRTAEIELQFLESLRTAAATQASAELLFAEKTATHADALAELLKTRVPDAQKRTRDAEFAARDKTARKTALERELRDTKGAAQWARRDIVVEVESPKAGVASISLAYVLPGASWTPAYDVRAHPDAHTLDLSLHALITQTSGEDWSDAALSLSTARPAAGIEPPVLEPYWLEEPTYTYGSYGGEDQSASGDAAMEDSEPERKGKMAVPMPPPAVPMRIATAEVTERAVATTFEVPGRTSVPGDGTARKVRLADRALEVDYLHVAVPRFEAAAFLVGSGTWAEAWPLLPGSVASFVEDSYVGTSILASVGTGATFEFSFGKDDSVKVDRETEVDLTSGTDWLGKVTRELGYRYQVTNHRKTPVEVEIRDRIPVSTQTRYRIRVTGDPPDKHTPEGLLTFVRSIPPDQTTSVEVTTVVRYPHKSPPGNLE